MLVVSLPDQVDCESRKSRISDAGSRMSDGVPLALPSWFQPARADASVTPHTVHAMAMTHICNGRAPASAPRVQGRAADIHDYQARFRRERLGY